MAAHGALAGQPKGPRRIQMLLKLRQRMARRRVGLHARRAPGRHAHHRPAGRDRHPGVLQPAGQGHDARPRSRRVPLRPRWRRTRPTTAASTPASPRRSWSPIEQSLSNAVSTTRPYLTAAAATGRERQGLDARGHIAEDREQVHDRPGEGTSQLTFTCTTGGTAGCPTGGVWARVNSSHQLD